MDFYRHMAPEELWLTLYVCSMSGVPLLTYLMPP